MREKPVPLLSRLLKDFHMLLDIFVGLAEEKSKKEGLASNAKIFI